ncbi:MAG: hypothetical protein EBY95_06225, partial [Actinobacteria bacterium]|nr:hypothetical protein [Actinomycetota bacterium]
MKVIIAGGGSVGRFTAREMVAAGHTVTIIDNDRATLREYQSREESAGIEWHFGDACDYSVLDTVGVREKAKKQLRIQESLKLAESLRKQGLATLDLTDNEMAKLHVRHMVGGHAPTAKGDAAAMVELLYRFEFPERPGALMHFLSAMRTDWNISLFHYRNHGADSGRVLVGMQVPKKEMPAFRKFLAALGYPHVDESANPAYR